MEDPVKEIPRIINAIVQNDDIALQEETIFRYFSESAVLDHPVVYCKGPAEILANYQLWTISNYSLHCTVHQVLFKEDENQLYVQLTQRVRKWWNPFDQRVMPMMVFFQLEDAANSGRENGDHQKTKGPFKRIVLQRDYHAYEPVLVNLPVIGMMYTALRLRNITSMISSLVVKSVQLTVGSQRVTRVGKGAFNLIGVKY